MAISKKIRFEVFKRDGFKCGYCGKNPPEVTLEADHIEPIAMGGTDNMSNLITACFSCNRGKRDIPLEKIPPKIQENLEVLIEQEEQIREYRKFIKKIGKRINADIQTVTTLFENSYAGKTFTENFKIVTIKNFLNKLPLHEVEESMDIATSKFPKNTQIERDRAIRYFCGVCWNKIKEKGNE